MDEHYLFTGQDAERALAELALRMPEGAQTLAQYAVVPDEGSATGASTLVLISGDEPAFKELVADREDFVLVPAMTADEAEESDEGWVAYERRSLFGHRHSHAPKMVHLAAPSFVQDAPTQTAARTGFSAERRFDVPTGHYLLSYLPRSTWFEVQDVLVSVSEGRPIEPLAVRRYTVHGWGPRTQRVDTQSAYLTGTLVGGTPQQLPDWVRKLIDIVASEVDQLIELTEEARGQGTQP